MKLGYKNQYATGGITGTRKQGCFWLEIGDVKGFQINGQPKRTGLNMSPV
jgi:hypothetical protein